MSDGRTTVTFNMGGWATALTLIFVVLKLTGVIAWSWWWVLSPILIAAGLGLVLMLIGAIVGLVLWRRVGREQEAVRKRWDRGV